MLRSSSRRRLWILLILGTLGLWITSSFAALHLIRRRWHARHEDPIPTELASVVEGAAHDRLQAGDPKVYRAALLDRIDGR